MDRLLAVATNGRRSTGSAGCDADRAVFLGVSELKPLLLLRLGDSSELLRRRPGGVEFVRSALGEVKRGRGCGGC